MAIRQSKTWVSTGAEITAQDIASGNPTAENLPDFLFAVHKDDINYNVIMNIFGEFDGKPLAQAYDLLEVPVGKWSYYTDMERKNYKSNKNKFVTTVGLFVFNIFLRDFNFSRLFNGYFNEMIDSDGSGFIEQTLSYALLEDDIDTITFKEWEDTMQWFMPFETILSPSHTETMLACTKKIDAKKKELIRKYKAELDVGSPLAAEKMEKELLDYAAELLKDDPSMDIILSGASGDWKNNFKNMFVMKGAIRNPDPNAKQSYNIVTGNYLDGIDAKDYPLVAGSAIYGAYSRGKKTENGGYYEKLFISAFQTVKIGPKNSDCGTKNHITVFLTKRNINDYMYNYMMKPNGTLELLTSKNKDKYINKVVNFRFSSMCKSKKYICNKCAGELFYMLGEEYIGLVISQIPDRLKGVSMKAFHDSTVQTTKFDAAKAFYPFDEE